MYLNETIEKIIEHTQNVVKRIKEEYQNLDKILNLLAKSKSIFILGSGRSKLVGEAFAMRLAQLGLNVHVIGDSTTISPKKKDLIIVISSSGSTSCIVKETQRLKDKGAKIIGVTANAESELATGLSEAIIDVGPWRDYNKAISEGNQTDEAPLGTLYEDTSLLILDGIIYELMKKMGKKEKDLAEAHY
ncbi:SIS domain-containing protein [Methanothermobacter tenebrarum]